MSATIEKQSSPWIRAKAGERVEVTQDALCFAIDNKECLFSESGEGSNKQRRFELNVATGKLIAKHRFWGNLYFDLSGIFTTREKLPVRRNHKGVVGYSDKVEIKSLEEGGVFMHGPFMRTPDADDVLDWQTQGFSWQASCYLSPIEIQFAERDEETEVNGMTIKGPATIFRKAELREGSFCELGADGRTSGTVFNDNQECFTITKGETKMTKNDETAKFTQAQLEKAKQDALSEAKENAFSETKNKLSEFITKFGEGNEKKAVKAFNEGRDLNEAYAEFALAEVERLKKENEDLRNRTPEEFSDSEQNSEENPPVSGSTSFGETGGMNFFELCDKTRREYPEKSEVDVVEFTAKKYPSVLVAEESKVSQL